VIPKKAFYVSPQQILNGTFTLDKNESKHAINVLRMDVGDEITLLDGHGKGYHGIIQELDNLVTGNILKTYTNLGENNIQIILAPALVKKDRFEFILEKATELGVSEIYPVSMERSVKNKLNLERCKNLLQSASKQTLRSNFPRIHFPQNLKEILIMEGYKVCAMIGSNQKLSQLKFNKIKTVIVIIGPEGDFTKKEIEIMKKEKVEFYQLGDRRLRSETAAINSLAILNELLDR
tara:strand:+ start:3600 stop:4304 length:705 start_codon:yes stop_codon:yes gene_type:complete